MGMRVARRSAESGFETVVFEEHGSIGSPVQCAGLVSTRVLEMTGTESVFMKAGAATVHAPNGKELRLDAGETRAVLLDRKRFDMEMAERAIDGGAHLELGCSVRNVCRKGEKMAVRYRRGGENQDIDAKVVIGADGPGSVVRRSAGLGRPREVLSSIQALVAHETEGINIYLGNHKAPGFFLWEVPHPEGTLVGLASEQGGIYGILKKHLEKKGWSGSMIGLYAGTIPLGLLDESVDAGLMLVGDAACQVKPLSGGGLYTGLLSADLCGKTLIEALEKGDVSKECLNGYHRAWRDEIGGEISKGLWMRKIYKTFSDRQLNELIHTLNNEKVIGVIRDKGDIDYPSNLAGPVLKAAPKLLKFSGPLIKGLF